MFYLHFTHQYVIMSWVSTTPLWVPLVVAGIGVVGTLTAGIAGGLITQRRADRRESATWARERERERERWAREDEARTFEQRREAFVEFYVAVKALAGKAYDHGYGLTERELPEGWQSDAFEKLKRLEFYADRLIARAASAAYGAAWAWGVYGTYDAPDAPDFHGRQEKYDQAELEMLTLMRKSLRIREGDLDLPPPGHSWTFVPSSEDDQEESDTDAAGSN